MTVIQSIDSEGRPSWTPVPEGYALVRAVEILEWAGHTEITVTERKAA